MKSLIKVVFIVVLALIPFISKAAESANQLKGRILLQIESKGEAWYVNPASNKRILLGSSGDFYQPLLSQAIGISNKDLAKIPLGQNNLSSANKNDKSLISVDKKFAAKQKGKLFVQVQAHGELWYVNPLDSKRYLLTNNADVVNIIHKFGLGVKNINLYKILLEKQVVVMKVGDGKTDNIKKEFIVVPYKPIDKIPALVSAVYKDKVLYAGRTISELSADQDYFAWLEIGKIYYSKISVVEPVLVPNKDMAVSVSLSGKYIAYRTVEKGLKASRIYLYNIETGQNKEIRVVYGVGKEEANLSSVAMNGDIVAWTENSAKTFEAADTWVIYLYDIGKEKVIKEISTKIKPLSWAPRINVYNRQIIWNDYINDHWDIYMYDVATNETKKISQTESGPYKGPLNSYIYKNKIAYEDGDLFFYDLLAHTYKKLTDKKEDWLYGAIGINNDYAVWTDHKGVNAIGIKYYNLKTGEKKYINENLNYNENELSLSGDNNLIFSRYKKDEPVNSEIVITTLGQ